MLLFFLCFAGITGSSIIYLNFLHKYALAKNIFLALGIAFATIFSISMELQIGAVFFFLFVPFFSFLFYGASKKANLIIVFGSLCLISVLIYHQHFDPLFTFPPEAIESDFLINTVLIYTLISFILYFQSTLVERINNRLGYLSNTDILTALSNRQHFDAFVKVVWGNAQRARVPLSALMIDIDFFKNYNDSYGHIKGDECLKKIAHTIQEPVKRTSDIVARFGGEEFIIVLYSTEMDDAMRIAQIICDKVMALNIPHNHSQVADVVTISCGVSCVIPDETSSYIDLIQQADDALYVAKNSGRNRVVINRP